MKKLLVLTIGTTMLVSSCGTYAGNSAYAGASLGAVLGSAIGGISDGPRGSDIGTLVGMAGGAVIGGAMGTAAEKAQQQKYEERRARRQRDNQRGSGNDGVYYDYGNNANDRNGNNGYGSGYGNDSNGYDNSGFDPTNSGDDRIYGDFGISGVAPEANADAGLVVRNLRFVDGGDGNTLRSGEVGKIVFEIMNRTSGTVYNVRPSVTETTGNRNIYVSQGICVEQIAPGRGVRYTAMVKAGGKLRDGVARFRVSVTQDGNMPEWTRELEIATRR